MSCADKNGRVVGGAEVAAALPPKPLYTKPCNGCGQCCMAELCEIAEMMFPSSLAPCPALIIRDGMARCGVVLLEVESGLEPLVAKALGIGCGCSMPDSYTTEEDVEAFDRVASEMIYGAHVP